MAQNSMSSELDSDTTVHSKTKTKDRTRDTRNPRLSIFKRFKQPTGWSATESRETRGNSTTQYSHKGTIANSINEGHQCTKRILNSHGPVQMVESKTRIPSPTSKPPEAPQESGLIPPLL